MSNQKKQILKIIKNENKKKNNNNTNNTSLHKNSNNTKQLTTTKNVPLTKSRKIKMPTSKWSYNKDGTLMMSHTELLTSVITRAKLPDSEATNNGFNVKGFKMNPGLRASFPFTSAIASNYTTFKFEALHLIFIPRGNVTRDGAVMIYAEYDPGSEVPENRIEFINRKRAQETQVFEKLDFKADKKDLQKEKSHYIRLGSVPEGSDVKLYDPCIFYFAYEGTPFSTLIGDIFIQYDLVLETPKLRFSEKQISNIENVKLEPNGGTVANNKPFGDLGKVVGDFAYSLLDTASGGLAGNILRTGKSVLKLLNIALPPAGDGSLSTDVETRVLIPRDNKKIDMKSFENIDVNEDGIDWLSAMTHETDSTLYNELFTDISSSNLVLNSNSINGSSNVRYKSYTVAVPAGGALQFFYTGGGTPVKPASAPTINMTDYDGVKTGVLNKDNIGFSYLSG